MVLLLGEDDWGSGATEQYQY
ncbi:hypothetical protein CGLO_10651 [Colletotrichum gloeosporioides Cg-14]|uniref:Uncharacterized protein n=1 Tax=Colletotrichum gloeosporioides (strain Cg-14) TaxID=1237896 RepID=T0KA93_COLGC|nr:hypothetical protein CGLO_10651 [Colletotrichum gloeosporioides Cg-14]